MDYIPRDSNACRFLRRLIESHILAEIARATVDILPSLLVAIAQFIGGDADDIAISLVKGAHITMKMALHVGYYVRDSSDGRKEETWITAQWVEAAVVDYCPPRIEKNLFGRAC